MESTELFLDVRNHLGESIVWDERRGELIWVDIHEGKIYKYGLKKKKTDIYRMPDRVGAVGLRESEGFVVALARGFGLFQPQTNSWSSLSSVEPDEPLTRLNDGRCDRAGRFVCGGMNEAEDGQAISGVYRLEPDGSVGEVLSSITCANSICFSPNGTVMYFTDMPTREITAYPYDLETGRVGEGWCFRGFHDQPGFPDGSTVDEEGCLWNAQWGGGVSCVTRRRATLIELSKYQYPTPLRWHSGAKTWQLCTSRPLGFS